MTWPEAFAYAVLAIAISAALIFTLGDFKVVIHKHIEPKDNQDKIKDVQ